MSHSSSSPLSAQIPRAKPRRASPLSLSPSRLTSEVFRFKMRAVLLLPESMFVIVLRSKGQGQTPDTNTHCRSHEKNGSVNDQTQPGGKRGFATSSRVTVAPRPSAFPPARAFLSLLTDSLHHKCDPVCLASCGFF